MSTDDEVWEEDEPDFFDAFEADAVPPDLPVADTFPKMTSQKSLMLWLIGFLLQLQAKHNIPDKALNLLVFLKAFFLVLGCFSDFVSVLASQFPSSMYLVRKNFFQIQTFTRFVVCSKCWNLTYF